MKKNVKTEKMYYDRVLTPEFAQLLENGGKLRWLLEFVREKRDDLDLLIGKNKEKGSEWISVYRGLSRCISINPKGKIDGAKTYMDKQPRLYEGKKFDFENELRELLPKIKGNRNFSRYYDNHKEGFFQNEFSRKYGIKSNSDSEFVIVDKEVVIGFDNKSTKKEILEDQLKTRYRKILRKIFESFPKRYDKKIEQGPIGNELDFLALDKNGNLLLIEFKHGSNTSGIYFSPIQIGLYYDIFNKYYEDYQKDFEDVIFKMLEQKQKIGLINPDWQCAKTINKIIPVLVISEYNKKCSAKEKYPEIMRLCRKDFGKEFLSNIVTYNFADCQLNKFYLEPQCKSLSTAASTR